MKKISIIGICIIIFCVFILPVKAQDCGIAETDNAKCCCVDTSFTENIMDPSGSIVVKKVIEEVVKMVKAKILSSDYERDTQIAGACIEGEPSNQDPCSNPSTCTCRLTSKSQGKATMCYKYLENQPEFDSCTTCLQGNGYWSALGCIYLTSFKDLVEKNILGYLVSFAGMAAFLCIIFAAFQMQTSQGNPEKIKKSQELLTSCIMGLMLIIFSVFILRFIGVALRIPGFS